MPAADLASFGHMSAQLPADYVEYLEDGADAASTEGAPVYFQLWAPDDIEEMNRSYRVAEFAPGFLAFGSDGVAKCSRSIATVQFLCCPLSA
jgi:hypothetical protein